MRFERVSRAVIRAIPKDAALDDVQVVLEHARGRDGASSGRMVRIDARVALRVMRSESDDKYEDAELAFLIAHEIGHLVSPGCVESCGGAAQCEAQADAAAHQILSAGGHSYGAVPWLLREVAVRNSAQLVEELDTAEQAGPVAQRQVQTFAERCLSVVEMYERYTNVELPDSMLTSSSRGVRDAIAQVLQDLARWRGTQESIHARCLRLIGRLDDPSNRACLLERSGRLQEAYKTRIPNYASDARELWSPELEWQDGASWLFGATVAPGWMNQVGRDKWGWGTTERLSIGWEGEADAIILRLGYGSWQLNDSDGPRMYRRFSVELQARNVQRLSEDFAALFGLALGFASDRWSGSSAYRGIGSFDARLGWRLLPRVHLSAGVGYVFGARFADPPGRSHTIEFPVLLEGHFGQDD